MMPYHQIRYVFRRMRADFFDTSLGGLKVGLNINFVLEGHIGTQSSILQLNTLRSSAPIAVVMQTHDLYEIAPNHVGECVHLCVIVRSRKREGLVNAPKTLVTLSGRKKRTAVQITHRMSSSNSSSFFKVTCSRVCSAKSTSE